MGKDFTRFKFKTSDNLPYNQRITVTVCIISISSIFEQDCWFYKIVFMKIVMILIILSKIVMVVIILNKKQNKLVGPKFEFYWGELK